MRKSLSTFRAEAVDAKTITRNAFKVDKTNTRFVYPMKLETTRKGYKIQTVTKIPKQRARVHVVQINFPPRYEGKFNACKDIKVDCNCERFLFTWNYALNQVGAAIKDRTNGDAPDITNPGQVPGICKHGLVMLEAMKKINPVWPLNKGSSGEYNGRIVRLTTVRDALR